MGTQHSENAEWWHDKTSEKNRGRLFGTYAGIVKDRNDPKKLGRVRVHCPAILPGKQDQENTWLPWALPKGGSLSPPPLGTPVFVTFEQGQVQHPIYEWGWLRGKDAATSEAPVAGKGEQDPTWKGDVRKDAAGTGPEFGATVTADPAIAEPPVYGFNKVFQSEGGHIFELDDSTDQPRARYQHPSGTSILIDPDGSVHIRAKGAIYNEPEGDYVVNLGEGAQFKVVYPKGTSLTVGPSGMYVKGHAVSIIGRFVRKNGEAI